MTFLKLLYIFVDFSIIFSPLGLSSCLNPNRPPRSRKMTFPSVKNILLLDSEGKRVTVKYYADDWPTNAAKLAFEKSVFTKTQKINARTEGSFWKLKLMRLLGRPPQMAWMDCLHCLSRPYLKLLQRLENTWQDLSSNNVVHEVLMLLKQLIPSATQVNRNDELVLPKEKLIEDHPDFVNFIFSLFT
ncbi:hypothetical protein HPP92_019540 [Vanilla planifolia]|uniref:Coatomer subunit zeta n=1 Tax=Vanilla planifolia TaxID=51239 RepID=A0A835Q742_VANPL|nr:hypothetical protein HPP92_019540 [Vanilla planifolia]